MSNDNVTYSGGAMLAITVTWYVCLGNDHELAMIFYKRTEQIKQQPIYDAFESCFHIVPNSVLLNYYLTTYIVYIKMYLSKKKGIYKYLFAKLE